MIFVAFGQDDSKVAHGSKIVQFARRVRTGRGPAHTRLDRGASHTRLDGVGATRRDHHLLSREHAACGSFECSPDDLCVLTDDI